MPELIKASSHLEIKSGLERKGVDLGDKLKKHSEGESVLPTDKLEKIQRLKEYVDGQLAKLTTGEGTVLEEKLAKYDKRKRQQIITLLNNFLTKEASHLAEEMQVSLDDVPRDEAGKEELRERLIGQLNELKGLMDYSQQPANVQMFYLERKIKSLFLTDYEVKEQNETTIGELNRVLNAINPNRKFVENFRIKEELNIKEQFRSDFFKHYESQKNLSQSGNAGSILEEESRLSINVDYFKLANLSMMDFLDNLREANKLINQAYRNWEIDKDVKNFMKEQVAYLQVGNQVFFSAKKGDGEISYLAKQYFGNINNDLVREAQDIFKWVLTLKNKPENDSFSKLKNIKLDVMQLKTILENAINHYWLEWIVDIAIRKGIKNIGIDDMTIEIPDDITKFAWEIGVLAHELEWHIFRSLNKVVSWFELDSIEYLVDEEGLAKYIENKISGELGKPAIKWKPYYILGMDFIRWGKNMLTWELETEPHNFYETFEYIFELAKMEMESFGYEEKDCLERAYNEAWKITTRLFRGLSFEQKWQYFPKDKAYLQGVQKITAFLEQDSEGKSLEDLYLGRVRLEDIDQYKKIISQTMSPEYGFYLPEEFILRNWQELLNNVL